MAEVGYTRRRDTSRSGPSPASVGCVLRGAV